MRNSVKKGLALVGLLALGASQAYAEVTIDTSSTVTDLGVVFSAVLGVAVIIFGYKKIQTLL